MMEAAAAAAAHSTHGEKGDGNESSTCGITSKTETLPSRFVSYTTTNNLTSIVLADNDLTGTVPPSIGALTRLSRLSLQGNQFTGTLPALDSVTELQELFLQDNRFNGTIPSLPSSSKLRVLALDTNEWTTGTIPPEMGQTNTALTQLLLHENRQLTGTYLTRRTTGRFDTLARIHGPQHCRAGGHRPPRVGALVAPTTRLVAEYTVDGRTAVL